MSERHDQERANQTSAVLLGLEREARAAPSQRTLGFVIVNRTRSLLHYDRAVLFEGRGRRSLSVSALSNVAVIERQAPMIVWLESALSQLARDAKGLDQERTITTDELPTQDGEADMAWWLGDGLWIPFTGRDEPGDCGLLLLRARGDWSETERVLLASLADCYGHAWWALGSRRAGTNGRWRKLYTGIAVLALGASLAIPVPQSVVAQAQVVASKPSVVTAPMVGVIEAITVEPNQVIQRGDTLFHFVAAEIEANLAMSEQAVAAAEADLRKTQQQAFGDVRSKGEMELKQAALDLRQIERDSARYLASQIEVKSQRDGIAIFPDAAKWQGHPVQTGMRLMQIADPDQLHIEIQIPVADAVATEPGSPVLLFLDIDPLNPIEAELERVAYGAELTAGDVLAYKATARLAGPNKQAKPRIGLRGTARISGDPVPLGMFLFRRPLSAVRQFIGW